MNPWRPFRDSNCAEQMHIAERELSAFLRAVTQLYGSEEAKLAAEDWLEESAAIDALPRSTNWNWRAVTIAASSRLANRLTRPESRVRAPDWYNDSPVLFENGDDNARGMKPL
jgi:hypothetical protein